MGTHNLSINFENLTIEERETLMKLVEKSQEKKSKVWKPSDCEIYWSIDSHQVFNSRWAGFEADKERYECGNCFASLKEAEEELARCKMLAKWKRLSVEAGEEENEWNGDNTHWAAYYTYYGNKIDTYGDQCCRDRNIYFPNEKSLFDAIKELGEENVKKYILEVRD